MFQMRSGCVGRLGLAFAAACMCFSACAPVLRAAGSQNFERNPYDIQVAGQIGKLNLPHANVRAGAAEALGLMRAYDSADALAELLGDGSARVRREAVMALSWCGGRRHVDGLLEALDDEDWVVRQAACVALNNLTGMEFAYDALAKPDVSKEQAGKWRKWWSGVGKDAAPAEVFGLVEGEDIEGRLRAVRALGAFGGKGAAEALLRLVEPYRTIKYDKTSPIERTMVQTAMRSLARLHAPEALGVLIGFLDTVGWARYAADALGLYGDPAAIQPLTSAYPRFAKSLRRELAKVYPRDDMAKLGWDPQDRMYETPYAIMVAISRLPLDNPDDLAAVRVIVPLIIANIPSDWDGGLLYEQEAHQLVTAFLLERTGFRRAAIDAAFRAVGRIDTSRKDTAEMEALSDSRAAIERNLELLADDTHGDVPYMAQWLPALCRDRDDVPKLIALLDHDNHWVRINAAKALMFMNAGAAVEPIGKRLAAAHAEGDYRFSGVLEHAEYNDPAPRWREAFVRALGRLGGVQYVPLIAEILTDERSVLEVRYAAAMALDELGTLDALASLSKAEREHPFHTVRLVAREALWRRGLLGGARHRLPSPAQPTGAPAGTTSALGAGDVIPRAIIFIKGRKKLRTDFNDQSGVDPWRETYSITNSGPTMRVGQNIFILEPATSNGKVRPLTHFDSGYVADCELSWDAGKVIFARRLNSEDRHMSKVPHTESVLRKPGEPFLGGADDPWWHLWEMNIDGTDLRQITFGPYHDVQPAYLPDGRIVFSSTRIGLRDEYHGFPCTGLSICNADGSDIHCVGFNLGGDREPSILNDGRIVFSRLDLFYSRLKTEITVQAMLSDGTKNVTLYGPERRDFWHKVTRDSKVNGWSESPPRHRPLRMTQPVHLDDGRIVCATQGGLTIIGPGRYKETIIPHDKKMAVTCPYPLGGGRILCSATIKQFEIDGKVYTATTEEYRKHKGTFHLSKGTNADLGLYVLDVETGRLTLLYNDPATAEFDARPVRPRKRPPVLAETADTRANSYTARLFCNSVRRSRQARVISRGKFVRVVEGMPFVSRHKTQQNPPGILWRNHGGVHARVLGTAPLAADGSFFVEVPADRLIHMQVLDSDRRVVGNQLIWMYVRPSETRSCVGCHEEPDTNHLPDHFSPTVKIDPVEMLPYGGEFTYRAKAWLKGTLPDEAEERSRVVRAVNMIARH